MRDSFLPFAVPEIDETELRAVQEVLESGWLTTGKQAKAFEEEFASAVHAKHGIALNSCTAAMHLALEAIGVSAGDEVITSTYTFAASAEVVRYFDARPVLVDIDPLTLNLDPEAVERAVSPRTKAIIPVHIGGLPADLERVYAVAEHHGLAVIEDAAHAFPAKYRGRMIGEQLCEGVRSAVCFSFYATKTITTGEGGMICTDDSKLADRCRIMALHGISRDAWKRYTAEGSWYYEIAAPGFKYNMTDVAAAMGRAQLAKAEKMWQRRKEIAGRFNSAFGPLPELQTPADSADCQHAWHLYPLRLNLERFNIDRAAFAEQMKAENIGISVHFIPLHAHPYYRDTYGYRPTDFPVAWAEYQREISLPIYSKMSDEDVTSVIDAVLDIVERHRA